MAFKYVKSFQTAPAVGSTYRFIGVPASTHPNLALMIGRRVWANNKADNARLAINNVFKTVAEAKAVRTKIVIALQTKGR